MQFHAQTMLTVSALVGVILTLMQLLAAARLKARSLAFWGLANLVLSAGCLLLAARGMIGLKPSVIAGNGLIFLGMGLIFAGIRAFDGQPVRLAGVVLGAAGGMGLLALSLWFGDNLPDRITITSLIIALWAGLAALALLERPGPGPILSRVPAGLMLGALALVFTVRGVAAQFGFTGGGTYPLDAPFERWALLVGLGLSVAWTFGSLFMVLERVASVDHLTGLLNRRAMLQQAAQVLGAIRARAMPLSVLMVDLDHFKSVNDRYGHDTGDAVLQRFAGLAQDVARPSDLVGRHGGEEFCIVLPGCDEKGAQVAAERVRALAEAQLGRVDERETRVTISIGVATFTPAGTDGTDIVALIAAADRALYAAKGAGRNRVMTTGEAAARGASLVPRLVAAQAR